MALWVVLYHLSTQRVTPLNPIQYGWVGVDVFFVLSGYLLMMVHATDFGRPTPWSYRRFLAQRWWRTYPLYAVAAVIAALAYAVVNGSLPSTGRLLVSAVLLDRWLAFGIDINHPVWSLGVEWIGYLVFPLLAAAAARLSPGRTVVALTVLLAVVCVRARTTEVTMAIEGWFAVERMASGFVAGSLVAAIVRCFPGVSDRRTDLAGLGALLLLSASLVGHWMPGVIPSICLLVAAAAPDPRWTARCLGSRPMLFLGRISFSLYLVHFTAMYLYVGTAGYPVSPSGKVGSTVLLLVGSLAVATFLCLAVEEPLRRFHRRRMARAR